MMPTNLTLLVEGHHHPPIRSHLLLKLIDDIFANAGLGFSPLTFIAKMPLTHFDETARPRMVDIGAKRETVREATASGEVRVQPSTLEMITGENSDQATTLSKGDPFSIAQIAGISAAKKTWDLIPLCHPLPLDSITVDLSANSERSTIQITANVRTFARTGVEMEALTAVGVAALTLYDMCKSADRSMSIENIRLLKKTGGKSGTFLARD